MIQTNSLPKTGLGISLSMLNYSNYSEYSKLRNINMQCYTASLDWSEYGEVKTAIQKHAADKEPDEGISVHNKVIAKLGGQYPAG